MAKRFTDTCKWKDSWFQDLPAKYKLFWIYLLDECDQAGVYKPNLRLASFQIGEPFEESELKRILGDRIEVIKDGYWFIKKFIAFQYGELSTKSKPHISVINLMNKYGIKGYTKGMDTLKDKDKEQEEDKEEEIQEFKIPKLDAVTIETAQRAYFSIKRKKIEAFQVHEIYQTFISLNYQTSNNKSDAEILRHFINWIKLQKIEVEELNDFQKQAALIRLKQQNGVTNIA